MVVFLVKFEMSFLSAKRTTIGTWKKNLIPINLERRRIKQIILRKRSFSGIHS